MRRPARGGLWTAAACLGIAWLGLARLVFAKPEFVDRIPNGAAFGGFPNSCNVCHNNITVNNTTNRFGDTFLLYAQIYNTGLAATDTDCDGFTNGHELQDPTGSWMQGQPNPGNPALVSDPSKASSIPPNLTAPAIFFCGLFWLDQFARDDVGHDNNPQIATDGQGRWVTVWSSADESGSLSDRDIKVTRTTGATVGSAQAARLNTNSQVDLGDDVYPHVATDREGMWIVVWQSDDSLGGTIGTDNDILYARSSNGGVTWTAPTPLNTNAATDTGGDFFPRIAADGQGTWVVVWESVEPLASPNIGIDYDILFSRSTNNGQSWSPPAALNSDAATDDSMEGTDFAPDVATDRHGNWTVVWASPKTLGGMIGTDFDLLFARSTDGGASWTPRAALNTNAATDAENDHFPRLAADGFTNWLVVWESNDTLGNTIGTDTDVLSALSTDDGATWSAPTPVNSFAPTDSNADARPVVGNDGTWNWLVAWMSENTLGGTVGSEWDILVSLSTDLGMTWTGALRLNESAAADSGLDLFPSIASNRAGKWSAVWESNEALFWLDTDFDILYAHTTIPLGPTPTPVPTLMVQGTVRDAQTQTPIPSARVSGFSLNTESVETDGAGAFSFNLAPTDPPTLLLIAQKAGYQAFAQVFDAAALMKTSSFEIGLESLPEPVTTTVIEIISPNEQPAGYFGHVVAGVPDVNLDGRPDLIVGAFREEIEGRPTNSGTVYVFNGQTGAPLLSGPLLSPSPENEARFGFTVAGLADVNGDGRGDIVVGAHEEDPSSNPVISTGRAHGFSGAGGALLYTLDSPTPRDFGFFGYAVAGIGDANGPGVVAVGAPSEGTSPTFAGRVHLFNAMTGAHVTTLIPPNETGGSGFGTVVAAMPDLTGDGRQEVLVGAPGSNGGLGAGYIFDGALGSVPLRVLTPPPSDSFGVALAAVPDVNGDQIPDVVMGNYVVAAIFSGADGALLRVLASPDDTSLGGFGQTLAGLDDQDGDGLGDVVVGAPNTATDEATFPGRAYLFSGGTGRLLRAFDSPNVEQDADFGLSVAGLGDVNDDGRDDIGIGARLETPMESDAGRAYVFFSVSPTPTPTATPTPTGTSTPTPTPTPPANAAGRWRLYDE